MNTRNPAATTTHQIGCLQTMPWFHQGKQRRHQIDALNRANTTEWPQKHYQCPEASLVWYR